MTTYSHMKCPFCSNSTNVYNSRSSHESTQTWRRRKCLTCNRTFTTREKVDYSGIITIKSDGDFSPYSRERLLLSLVRASDKLDLPPAMLTELTDSIELELKQVRFFLSSPQESARIVATALEVLKRYDQNLAIRYISGVYNNKPPGQLLSKILAP